MPIYEYQCTSCGHHLNELQKMSDAPLVDCPKCNQPRLTKLVSAAGFQLKGSGWYVTDYSGKGKAKPEGADQASESAKQETKTDVKSEQSSTGSTTGSTGETKT